MTAPHTAALLLAVALVAGCKKANDVNAPAAAPVAATPAPAGKQWVEVVSLTPDGGYRMGNPDAPVKLIEYGSRTCPVCNLFEQEGVPALKSGPIVQGKLSYEFRDFPVHGPLDLGPQLVGRCLAPEQYFPMLEAMFAAQEKLLANEQQVAQAMSQPNLTPIQIATGYAEKLGYIDFVKQRGVPEAKVRACLSDPAAIAAVAKRADFAGQQFNVTGTPTFIVNGNRVEGAASWEALQPALRQAGAL